MGNNSKTNHSWRNYNGNNKRKNKINIQELCRCSNGHTFNYKDRIRFSTNNPYYAPSQGKCPICGTTEFSFMGSGVNIYPIKYNYTS